jgi:NAD(P)-dependent dehydrogenase (short-subunit alcohol dehydrogenase family)
MVSTPPHREPPKSYDTGVSVGDMGSANFDFEGETVLVTGAGSGIGREIARRFGESGAAVVVADVRETPRDEGETTPTHELIAEAGGEAAYVETDVTDPDALVEAVDRAEAFGGLDVMVNNAGIHVSGTVREISPESFDRIHAVNVRGTFFGTQAAADAMVERGQGGTILNMASISSTQSKPGQVAYESTKGAIRMITKGAAVDLAPEIRVNALAPGRIATEFGGIGAAEKARLVAEGEGSKPIPLGRAGYPADVAGAALFLASDEAAYVTGELLYVDGGYSAI